MTETTFAHIFTTIYAKLRNSNDSMLPNYEKCTVAVKLGRGNF